MSGLPSLRSSLQKSFIAVIASEAISFLIAQDKLRNQIMNIEIAASRNALLAMTCGKFLSGLLEGMYAKVFPLERENIVLA